MVSDANGSVSLVISPTEEGEGMRPGEFVEYGGVSGDSCRVGAEHLFLPFRHALE